MFRWLILALALGAAEAGAKERTLITDYTGLDCTRSTKQRRLSPRRVRRRSRWRDSADLTQVHVLGGKQDPPNVAFPNSDAEWARTG